MLYDYNDVSEVLNEYTRTVFINVYLRASKKMLLMQQGEYTAKNKILILLNRIGLSMCMVVHVLVVRISTIVKGPSSQD